MLNEVKHLVNDKQTRSFVTSLLRMTKKEEGYERKILFCLYKY